MNFPTLPRRWGALLCLAASLHFATAQESRPASTTATNAAPAVRQVWDYAEELGLSAEQTSALARLKADYETAQRTQRAVRDDAEAPPDRKRAASQEFSAVVRRLNQEIAKLLTEGQRTRYAALRSPRRAAASTNTAVRAEAATSDESTPAASSRRPTRPSLDDDALKALAAELRTAYTKPATEWPAPTVDDSVKPHYVELGLLPPVPFPTNNAYSAAKAALGKQLFFDPRLSGSLQIACASCHDPDLGWTDGRTVSFGHSRKELKRNAPTLNNVGHQGSFFWDGRSPTLEAQIVAVLANEDEMRSSQEHLQETIGRLSAYTNAFQEVFGSAEPTVPKASRAIATFVRTITSQTSPYDAFLRGNTNALDDAALRGLHLFRTAARCANCHHGPNLTDDRFHNIGLSYYGRKLEDLGRYRVTGDAADVGAFRTPSLRNLERTAPYMHNGLFDLDGVLNLYNAGMPTLRRKESQKDDPLFPTKSHLLQPLGLNRQEIADLKAFLESLTESRIRVRPPVLP